MTTATRTTHTPGPHIVDPCPDANGHATIRLMDEAGEADIHAQPLATVYRYEDAVLYAAAPDYYDAAEAIRAHVVAAERLDDGDECRIPEELIRALLEAHRKTYTA